MESGELRNQLLSELIGKMQSRLADKEYPDEKKEEVPVEEAVVEETEPKAEADADESLSDEDVETLMQAAE